MSALIFTDAQGNELSIGSGDLLSVFEDYLDTSLNYGSWVYYTSFDRVQDFIEALTGYGINLDNLETSTLVFPTWEEVEDVIV